MTGLRFTARALKAGMWHGHVDGAAERDGAPRLSAWHLDVALDGLRVTPAADGSGWDVALPVPAEVLSDGVRTILIRDDDSDATLAALTLIAGEAAGEDLRSEVALLRAELDMLKRAFRRHCVESGG